MMNNEKLLKEGLFFLFLNVWSYFAEPFSLSCFSFFTFPSSFFIYYPYLCSQK